MASAMYHSISSLRKAIELRPTFHFFQKIQIFLYSNSPQPSITQQQGPFASCLDSRSVIRFSGEDTIKFLQGLLTNDVRPLSDPPKEELASLPTPNQPIASHSPLYSALLTPQGRFLYDLFLYRPASRERKLGGFGGGREGDDDDLRFTVFADVDSECKEEVLQVLKRYRLRAKVDIDDASEEFACWQRFGAKLKESSTAEDPEAASVGWGGGVDAAGSSSAQGNSCGWRWFKDPRLSLLGYRGIFPSKTTPPLVEADEEVDERHYLLWRIEQGVAEGSSEIPKGEAIPLEYNFAGLNAISFDKGCYVGQELIARTHHRGVIRKRLLPLTFINSNGEENHTVSPGSEVVDTSSGKNIGSVTTAVGSRGMGVLRLESALQDSASLRIKELEDVHIKALRPEWWPAEWGHEYEQQAAA